jgi:hypothetical protein
MSQPSSIYEFFTKVETSDTNKAEAQCKTCEEKPNVSNFKLKPTRI